MSTAKEKIVVAMSGGVDSSVAAALLMREGFDPVGVTLRLWDCDEEGAAKACCGIDQAGYAREAAGRLSIPHFVVDAREEFEAQVLKPAWEEYASGRTPNPCVACNEKVKFGLLLEKAKALGAARVASGHHARIVEAGDAPALERAKDRSKDQSYYLFSLSPDQLRAAATPVGEYAKVEIRRIARDLGFASADRPESQDACFAVEDGGFAEALRLRFGGRAIPGDLVDDEGRVLGRHEGIHRVTIGQRRGLGVALGRKAYVSAIRADRAEVVVSVEDRALLAAGLVASQFRWLVPPGRGASVEGKAQIRSRHAPVNARAEALQDGRVRVRFEKSQRAVAPGQAVVLYRNDRVLGGGWIENALPEGHDGV
ncbi:MAG: tRNA 2-thiouridine(34) synthase MnmA [Planctomycetota bacterium]|jgi:tRNA-specific 2-thiouridylase